ncbi:MAG: hypothetical protein B7X94_00565 [Hydrogenophilales bacterium 17-62-8]|nr:MAG: hypothetical protein B7X94_00565 [Hydrogenophilales bacterium 17-62-8]
MPKYCTGQCLGAGWKGETAGGAYECVIIQFIRKREYGRRRANNAESLRGAGTNAAFLKAIRGILVMIA